MPRKSQPPEQRFWAKVVRSGGADGCWLFTGAKVGPKGHRVFIRSTGCRVLAHRFSWELAHGDPGEMCVLHRCDNPQCVRPDHLFLGTKADNNADMQAKGRRVVLRGTANPRAKLDPEKVGEIRRLRREQRLSTPKLAGLFGVGVTTIQAILEGRTWKTAA